MSKLEPHLVQPKEDCDVDEFLREIEEESSSVPKLNSETELQEEGIQTKEDEVRQGFVRLVDFIEAQKRRPRKKVRAPAGHQSLRALAIKAYQYQDCLSPGHPKNPLEPTNYLKKSK